jgi:hypothetical protein
MRLYQPSHTVADIFRSHFDQYVQHYGPLPIHYYKAANAIMQCRTEQLGGHIYKCDTCSHEITLYNSCRNRHCPQCQAMARAQWVERRMEEALPVPYFHVVFTIPHQLNSIALRNKKTFYQLLFKAVFETLLTLAQDPKRLGGQIGFIAVLHTWGQNLMDHPHIHCIVPGGAFRVKENVWNNCKNNFLFPVPVMQKLFRAKCMDFFRKAIDNGTINPMFSVTPDLPTFSALIQKLYSIKWVVYVKKPFTSPENLIKYLSRYTHRVAIANHRIIHFENGQVTFSYKDYSDENKRKTMSVSAVEFIRRFMLHILPQGFMRIRQYGFLSNKVKKKLLPCVKRAVLKTIDFKMEMMGNKNNTVADVFNNSLLCPICNKGTLKKDREVDAVIKGPSILAVND